MADSPNVALTLSSVPQNVSVVRAMLSGVAESIELDRGDHDDIRAAVTEACNNVVLHAYAGAPGPLEVEVFVAHTALEVVVRDRGIGFPGQLSAEDADGGLGLPMMRALTRALELREVPGRGSEARMEFATPSARILDAAAVGLPAPALEAVADSVVVADSHAALTATIAPAELARGVLPRVLSAVAAHAHFSTDRISDAQLVADALAAYAHEALGARTLGLAVEVEPRDLQLRIGPLAAGERRGVGHPHLPIRRLDDTLESLTDAHRVVSVGPHEVLALRLLDRR